MKPARAAGMLCFYGALNLAPVSKVKPIAFALAPVVGALLGWLVLHERMPATKWVALVLIVAGVVLLTREA